jgi:predicted PurR-regulated permease PerM
MFMNDKTQTLDISWGTVIKIAFALFVFYLIYLVRDVLVWSLFALIISVLLNPAIDFLHRKGLQRFLAAFLVYFSVFGILSLFIYWIFPLLFFEIRQFSQLFPQHFERISPPFRGLGIEAFENIESFVGALGEFFQEASDDIFSALAVVFGGIGSTFFVGSVAFFISLEEKGIERLLAIFIPERYESYVLDLWERCQVKTANWFGARVLTGIFVGILVFITLKLFNVRYAFTLSFISAVLEIVPILGPVLAALISFILVGLDSWLKGIFVLGAFVLIQQLEGNVFTPILAKRIVGIPPALILISLAIGGRLLGFLGAILTVPIAGILFEFGKDFLKEKKEQNAREK